MSIFEQKLFDKIKPMVTRDTLLIYAGFKKCFYTHMDASNCQLGSVMIQIGKSFVLYSHKLTKPQQQYTVTEKEWLSIVETLK